MPALRRAPGARSLSAVFDGLGLLQHATAMTALLLAASVVFAQEQGAPPCPSGALAKPASLVVQTVDETWLPMPGVTVRVIGGKERPVVEAITDRCGFAFVSVPAGTYTLEAAFVGFKMKAMKNVRVSSDGSAVPQVQLMLRVAAPKEIISWCGLLFTGAIARHRTSG